MSYQHLGHRRRPRERSRSSDQYSKNTPAAASTQPVSPNSQSSWPPAAMSSMYAQPARECPTKRRPSYFPFARARNSRTFAAFSAASSRIPAIRASSTCAVIATNSSSARALSSPRPRSMYSSPR